MSHAASHSLVSFDCVSAKPKALHNLHPKAAARLIGPGTDARMVRGMAYRAGKLAVSSADRCDLAGPGGAKCGERGQRGGASSTVIGDKGVGFGETT